MGTALIPPVPVPVRPTARVPISVRTTPRVPVPVRVTPWVQVPARVTRGTGRVSPGEAFRCPRYGIGGRTATWYGDLAGHF